MWCVSLLLLAAPGLAFDEAVARADSVDDVAGLAQAVQVRTAGQHQSLFTSNPQVTFQPGLRTEGSGGPGVEGQLTLSQQLNIAGLGAARAAVQRRDLELATLEHRSLRLERRLAVATAWVELWATQEASRLTLEESARARELVARLERTSATGGSTRVEVATARATAAEFSALHLEWEGRRVDAAAALAELLGLGALVDAAGPLPHIDDSFAPLVAERQLPVELAQGALRGERARLEESQAQWGTQLQLSVQGGHEAPTQWFGNVGVGFTLPLLEQGRRERTAHEAQLEKLKGALSLAERRAEIRLQVLEHELEHTAQTLQVLLEEQLPAAEEALALETKRFAMGEATLLELTLLQRQALSARVASVLARARYAGARARAKELRTP